MTMPISVRKKDGGKIPGPANVPGVLEIKFIVQLPNQKMVSGSFNGYTVTPPANLQTLASGFFTSISGAWSSNLALYMATQTVFTRVELRDMTSYLNPVYIGTGAGIPGTSASPAMPVANAIVLTENIAARGKGLKGRVFLGGWATNADAGSGLILGAVQTAINAFGTAVFNAISTQTLVPCVPQPARQQYQGLTGTVHAARGASHVNVTTYTCANLIWDTQRRRVQL